MRISGATGLWELRGGAKATGWDGDGGLTGPISSGEPEESFIDSIR